MIGRKGHYSSTSVSFNDSFRLVQDSRFHFVCTHDTTSTINAKATDTKKPKTHSLMGMTSHVDQMLINCLKRKGNVSKVHDEEKEPQTVALLRNFCC